MPTHFDLVITADHANATSELRLLDARGTQMAFRQTDFTQIPVGQQRGLFNLRDYLRLYVEAGKEAAAVADIGVCIAEEVLGKDIFQPLWQSESQRTLRIQLPGAATEENVLAAALAGCLGDRPPERDAADLAERDLLVRVVHDTHGAGVDTDRTGAPTKPARAVRVCRSPRHPTAGAAQGAAGAARAVREGDLPARRVVAHVLSHGVTRERLEAQIREKAGYHIVHWSGHGHLNLLELAKPGGAQRSACPARNCSNSSPTPAASSAALLPQRLSLRRYPPRGGLERLPRCRPGQGAGHGAKDPAGASNWISRSSPATPARPTRCCKAACRRSWRCATPWGTTTPASWRWSSTARCSPTRSRRMPPPR